MKNALRYSRHTKIGKCKRDSETVDLNGSLGDAFFDQECRNLDALISLKLNDFTSLFVVNKIAVACEFLLKLGG